MSVYTGESRGELLSWMNELLAPQQVTKLEQCGTGAVYCQIIDSIYGNLPMSRVKLNPRMEYEYLDNFKILQKAFKQNQIDKPIPVDRLVKCKMQDNLEFLQWMKKYWDLHSRGDGYDAAGRAGGIVQATSRAPINNARTATARTRTPVTAAGRSTSFAGSQQMQVLNTQVHEMQLHCESLEKERDFYFNKLRDIEVIVQERSNVETVDAGERVMLGRLQEILYSTEEGFEPPVPEGEGGAEGELNDEAPPDDEETF
ncbi:microtubule-associated protein, RP/EB family, partial [Tremellales sp. Uapishka_1]